MTLRYDLFTAIRNGRIQTVQQAKAAYPHNTTASIEQQLHRLYLSGLIHKDRDKLAPIPGAMCEPDGRGLHQQRKQRNGTRGDSRAFDRTELERCWPVAIAHIWLVR